MDYMNDLYELCDTISTEIADATEKIRNAGGKLSTSDVDYIDKLTHTLKSIKGVMNMEDSGDSMNAYPYGMSYRGRSSYARGRMNARRDSMGRYSRDDGMVSQLREMMDDAPNETVRREMQKLVEKMEQR